MSRAYYVGGYAGEITLVRLEGGMLLREAVWTGAENPSYVLAHPNGSILYAVEEQNPEGGLTVFSVEGGQLSLLARMPSGGADPCHLALSDDGAFLLVSNYSSGTLSLFALDSGGIPIRLSDRKEHVRNALSHGCHPRRQEGPHVHFAAFCSEEVLVCDLGLDTVYRYGLDRKSGRLTDAADSIRLPAGTGPRHLCTHPHDPSILYVIAELTGEIYVYHLEASSAKLLQVLPLLPAGTLDPSGHDGFGAAIRMSQDGGLLYCSLRVRSGIAVCKVETGGRLSLLAVEPSGGETPRDFAVAGYELVVCNQGSNQLTVLRWDDRIACLQERAVLNCSRPTCICPAPMVKCLK